MVSILLSYILFITLSAKSAETMKHHPGISGQKTDGTEESACRLSMNTMSRLRSQLQLLPSILSPHIHFLIRSFTKRRRLFHYSCYQVNSRYRSLYCFAELSQEKFLSISLCTISSQHQRFVKYRVLARLIASRRRPAS